MTILYYIPDTFVAIHPDDTSTHTKRDFIIQIAMAALKFHITELKYTRIHTGNEDQENRRSRLSRLLTLFRPKPTLHDIDVPEGYDSIDYKIFLVLSHFLQPDSTLSSIDAAEHVISVFPYKYPDLRQLISVCFEIAEQIPYHHPSQIKLVRLLWIVGRSAMHFEKPYQKVCAFYVNIY